MESAKHMATPMSIGCYLDKDEFDQSIDMKQYRGMIKSLLYLSTSRISCLVYACVLGSNPTPNNHI